MKRKVNNNYNKITINNEYQFKNLIDFVDIEEQINEIEISIPNNPIDLKEIPKSVSILKFNYNFINLPSEIPKNIKSVYFYEFTCLIEELPYNLEHIKIYKGFNHPVDKIHNNLKSIEFGLNFNHSVDNLPTSLEKVVFSKSFTHSINNLPHNIKFIFIHNPNYDLSSIKILPKSIILLQLGLSFNDDLGLNFSFDYTFNLNNKYHITQYVEENFEYAMIPYLRNIYFYK